MGYSNGQILLFDIESRDFADLLDRAGTMVRVDQAITLLVLDDH
jgi:hypothetical protein